MDLEFPDTPFRVNAWSKNVVDIIAEMDSSEKDAASFGQFKLKEEFMNENEGASTSNIEKSTQDLFGGADGLNSWIEENVHPSCSENDKIKATTVVKKFASGLGSLLAELVMGLTSPSLTRTSPRKAGRNLLQALYRFVGTKFYVLWQVPHIFVGTKEPR